MNLKEALKGKIPAKEIDNVVRAFEVLGDIAIITVPEEIEDKKKVIAGTLVSQHKNIKIVLRKIGDVSGECRIAKYELLVGDRTDTITVENGCRLKVDPTKVYFSERLGHERQKIVEQVKDGEKILCMFAGIGPFPICIAKNRDVKIEANELNEDACELFKWNASKNKYAKDKFVSDRINIACGDSREESLKLKGKFDRILMPAPKIAWNYLDVALEKVKKGGIINFYTFAGQEELETLEQRLTEKCESMGHKIKILEVRRCGHFAPYVRRFCVDFKVM